MTTNNKTKHDILVVITDAAANQAALFPLTEVTSFDLRGNGALAILNGRDIVNAYAAGYWQRAFYYTQAQFDEANARAAEAVKVQEDASKVADELNKTQPVASESADNVVPIAP